MAYFDTRNERALLRDGRSVVTPEKFARNLIENKPNNLKVLACKASHDYDKMFGETISSEIEDIGLPPPETDVVGMLDEVLDCIINCDRYEEQYEERVLIEVDFFNRVGVLWFILKLRDLIAKFKTDGVVWGVGRGSGCASLVLFLLEVHDINPVLYEIPFSEMSKE